MTNEEKILENTEEILTILKTQFNIDEKEPTEDEPTIQTQTFKEELIQKLQSNNYNEIVAYIKYALIKQCIYSEEDMLIKVSTDNTGDTILEVKIKPYQNWGKTVDWFYDTLGEPEYFETSKYYMRVIFWYKLTKYQQMNVDDDGSDIVDDVNEEWDELNG